MAVANPFFAQAAGKAWNAPKPANPFFAQATGKAWNVPVVKAQAQTPLVKPPVAPGAGNPGQTAGTSGTSGPSPLDSTYFNNVATNQFKVNNQINGLNSGIANQQTALQAALGQLAYQQPRAQLALEEGANRRGALYSTGYNQQLGDLNQKYLTNQNSLTTNEGAKVAALNSQIQALLGGIPLYNQGQALASALRTSAAAANNPATGQAPAVAPAAPPTTATPVGHPNAAPGTIQQLIARAHPSWFGPKKGRR